MVDIRILIIFFTLVILFSSNCLAFYNADLNSSNSNFSYFYMPDQAYNVPSSALTYDFNLIPGWRGEVLYVGSKSWYVYSNYTNQLGLHAKKGIFEWGALKVAGIAGWGGLYSSANGLSSSLDIGQVSSYRFNETVGLSLATVPSVFSDGILMNFFVGIDYTPEVLNRSQIILGGRSTLSVITSGSSSAFENRNYAVIGSRLYF